MKNRDVEASRLIFGHKNGVRAVRMRNLAGILGISPTTLYKIRMSPGEVRLEQFSIMAKELELSDEVIIAIIRQYQ